MPALDPLSLASMDRHASLPSYPSPLIPTEARASTREPLFISIMLRRHYILTDSSLPCSSVSRYGTFGPVPYLRCLSAFPGNGKCKQDPTPRMRTVANEASIRTPSQKKAPLSARCSCGLVHFQPTFHNLSPCQGTSRAQPWSYRSRAVSSSLMSMSPSLHG